MQSKTLSMSVGVAALLCRRGCANEADNRIYPLELTDRVWFYWASLDSNLIAKETEIRQFREPR
jgi:hypothetical protein